MSDLDDRLREILNELRAAPNHRAAGAIIDAELAIKQAFADEGYIHLPQINEGDYIAVNTGEVRLNGDGTMTPIVRRTGQEWSTKFQEAFKKNLDTFVEFSDIDMDIYNSGKEAAITAALEAASGIDEV
jgi:hypothetical protein